MLPITIDPKSQQKQCFIKTDIVYQPKEKNIVKDMKLTL